MSTPEFFALQGLVATIVSAFENGLAIVQMIKQQRQESGAAPPSENLEDSLTIGSSTVESKMEEVKRLYMSARTVGDDIAVKQMNEILIELQAGLLLHLRKALEDERITTFHDLIEVSDRVRVKTVMILEGLSPPFTMANPIQSLGTDPPELVPNTSQKRHELPFTPHPLLSLRLSGERKPSSKCASSRGSSFSSVASVPFFVSDSKSSRTESSLDDTRDRSSIHRQQFDTNIRGLYLAALQGNIMKAELILKEGAGVNKLAGYRGTALHAAVSMNHFNMVELLLNNGADINAIANDRTPLVIAARKNNFKMVRFLIEKGAELNVSRDTEGTAIHAAISRNNLTIGEFLVEKGADISIRAGDLGNFLYDAVTMRNLEMVEFLLERGADINAAAEGLGTPLYRAVSMWNLKMVELLLERGADVNAAAVGLGTPLNRAITVGNLRMVEFLLERGADVNAAARGRSTPLQIARSQENKQIVELLLEKGADANPEVHHLRSATQAPKAGHGNERRGQKETQRSASSFTSDEDNSTDQRSDRATEAKVEAHDLPDAPDPIPGDEGKDRNETQPSASLHTEDQEDMPDTLMIEHSVQAAANSEDKHELSSGSYAAQLWKKLSRPRIRPGYRRVEWTCECGDQLYDDFDDSTPGTVDMMAELLNRPTGGEHSASNSSSSSSITLPVSAQPGFGGSPQSPNEIKTSVPGSMIGKQRRTETSGSPSDGQEVQRYFELCLNHDSLEKRLGEINLTKVRNDGELFDKIRVRYSEIRGPRINRLYLLKPVGVHYVRFSLEDRHRVWIFEEPSSWPPKEEVDARRWDFKHPISPPPPMPPKAFLHYMQSSEPHRNTTWLSRLPKKLEVSMLREAAELPSAWGVSIVEGADKGMVLLLLGIALSISLAIAILWSVLKNDAAVGMAIGTYLVALVAIIATFLAAKWQRL